MKKTTLTISLALAGLIGLAAMALAPNIDAASPPHTVKVTNGTVTRIEPLAGTITSTSEASVSYSGPQTTVSTVSATVGQSVVSGQILAQMTNGTTLTAPFAGRVVEVSLNAGDVVPNSTAPTSSQNSPSSAGFGGGRRPVAGQSVVNSIGASLAITIADTTSIDVTASVSELDVHWFKAGQSATFIVPGEPGVIYAGKVQAVNQDPITNGNGTAVSYPIIFTLNVPSGTPYPWLGMSCQVFVPVAQAKGLVVPIAAIESTAQGGYEVVTHGQKTSVTLGLIGTNQAIVTNGLTSGDLVVSPPALTEQPVSVSLFGG